MLFSKSPEEKLLFLVEIQSTAVRGSLVLLREKQPPYILFTASADMPLKAGATSAYLVKTTLKAVADTIDMLGRRHHSLLAQPGELPIPKTVSSVHYVLSSPWIISQAKTVSIEFPKESALTKAKVLEIIETERSKLSLEESQTEVVEEKIFDVKINGYSVGVWENRPAKKVEVSFVVSLSGANMSKRLRESCEHAVKKNRVYFHSSLLLEAIGIGIAMPEAESFVLVNIHGGLTEITVVKEKRSVFFGSYPTGVDTVVHKAAKAAKTDDKAADSLLSMLETDSIDPTHGKPLEPLVAEVMQDWCGEFDKLSKDAIAAGTLPSQTFIAARKHEGLFMRYFSKANSKVQVTPFALDRLRAYVSFDQWTERRRSIGLISIAINSLKEE